MAPLSVLKLCPLHGSLKLKNLVKINVVTWHPQVLLCKHGWRQPVRSTSPLRLSVGQPADWPSEWPRRHWACSRAHLSEPVIASWLRDIWLKCTATDYYYPFLREQFFSLSGKEGRGRSIKLGKIARRRMNWLPGRKAGGKVCWSWSTTPANDWGRGWGFTWVLMCQTGWLNANMAVNWEWRLMWFLLGLVFGSN